MHTLCLKVNCMDLRPRSSVPEKVAVSPGIPTVHILLHGRGASFGDWLCSGIGVSPETLVSR